MVSKPPAQNRRSVRRLGVGEARAFDSRFVGRGQGSIVLGGFGPGSRQGGRRVWWSFLQQFGDVGGGSSGAVWFNGPVGDLAMQLFGEGGADDFRRRVLEVHAAPRAVAIEPVADMEVLFEVVTEREIEEWPPVGGELHCR